jgi:nitroimidazol reductase NimA-like FMN-containing flavoprotein (pyridoxamine 5'-phosphate oxidase superfamily)
MTDRPADPTIGAAPSQDPASSAGDEPGTALERATDRRAFLRHLSRDAVWTAGRVAGWSSMVRRSMVAAGEAASAAFTPGDDEAPAVPTPAEPTPEPSSTAGPAAAATSVPATAVPAASATTSGTDGVAALTAEQHAFLDRSPRLTLAVNDPAGAPHVTSSAYHWDGATFRLPGRQFSLRASNVERDPRVSLFIDEPSSDASVTVTGLAALVYGDDVEAGVLEILMKDGSLDEAQARLAALRAEGDLILIEVRPTRFVWRSA